MYNQRSVTSHASLPIAGGVVSFLLSLLALGCANSPKPQFEDPYELNRPDCRIAVIADCDSEYLSRKIFNKAQIVPFDQYRPAVWQLMAEKVDGFVFDEHVLRLAQWQYPDRFRVLEQPIDTDPSVIAVAKGRPEVRDRLNRFIADIRANGVYDQMFLRWCHDPERRPDDSPDMSKLLCNDPQAQNLRIGVDPVQEPNAYYSKSGRLLGYDIEFAYRFGRAEKYRIEFVADEEQNLLKMLQEGELDVVISNLGKDASLSGVLWTDGYLDADIMMMVKEK